MITFDKNKDYLFASDSTPLQMVSGATILGRLLKACREWVVDFSNDDPFSDPIYAFKTWMEEEDFGDVAEVWEILDPDKFSIDSLDWVKRLV